MSFGRTIKVDGVHHFVVPNKWNTEFVGIYTNTLFLVYDVKDSRTVYAVVKDIDKALLKAYLYEILDVEDLLKENQVEFYEEVSHNVLRKMK